MISERSTNSMLAALLSIPPLLLVATLVDRMLPPTPLLPAVVAANDRRIDALNVRPKSAHRGKWVSAGRPVAYRDDHSSK